MFTFDSHSRNTDGLHHPNGRGVLLSFSTTSSLSDNVKSFYKISRNIFIETQYDLQYISINITDEIKNEVVNKLWCRRKTVSKKSSNKKQLGLKTGIKTSKKKKNDKQIY